MRIPSIKARGMIIHVPLLMEHGLKANMLNVERLLVLYAHDRFRGNNRAMAKFLGIGPQAMVEKRKKFGLRVRERNEKRTKGV